jgi:hypothetical protein
MITISQYIEAICSPDGRMRTLERVRPAEGEPGVAMFSMPGHGLVDFEVIAGDDCTTLRCPLRRDASAVEELRVLAAKDSGLGSRYFAEWRVLEREIVLFDDNGDAFEVDILARTTPEGEPMVDFLDRAVARGDVMAVDTLARESEKLSRWAGNLDRGIALGKLLVAPDGTPRVKGFSASDETDRIHRVLGAARRAARAAKALRNAQMVQAAANTPDANHAGEHDGVEGIRLVRDGGGWMYVDRAGRAVIDDVWLTAEPFRGNRAQVETREGHGLIDIAGRRVLEPVYEEVVWDDYWGLVTTMAEGRWLLADSDGTVLTAEPYDWLGECSEGMVLAQRGDRCGFLDICGREVVPCIYDDASSFSDGCALVTLDGEEFFIDPRGRKI